MIGKSIVSALFFGLILFFLVYAASTISSLGGVNIESGDKIGSGWFQEVDNKLSELSNNIFISGSNVGIGTTTPKSKFHITGSAKIPDLDIKLRTNTSSCSSCDGMIVEVSCDVGEKAIGGIIGGSNTFLEDNGPSNEKWRCKSSTNDSNGINHDVAAKIYCLQD